MMDKCSNINTRLNHGSGHGVEGRAGPGRHTEISGLWNAYRGGSSSQYARTSAPFVFIAHGGDGPLAASKCGSSNVRTIHREETRHEVEACTQSGEAAQKRGAAHERCDGYVIPIRSAHCHARPPAVLPTERPRSRQHLPVDVERRLARSELRRDDDRPDL
jgi:hypothetical protein